MADEPQAAFSENIPSVSGEISAVASASASFIYVDGVPTFGYRDGIISMTLEALRHMSVKGTVVTDRVIVGHVRMPLEAFKHLKRAVEGIELMMASPDKSQVN